MTDLISMKVLDPCHNLLEKSGCLLILQPLLFNDIVEEFTTGCILHDEEKLSGGLDNLIQLHYVWVADYLQDIDFSHDSHCFLFILDLVLLQDLDRDSLICRDMRAKSHLTKRALAQRFTYTRVNDEV